jgi:hypothetical protein
LIGLAAQTRAGAEMGGAECREGPLTLALSPAYGGEGIGEVAGGRAIEHLLEERRLGHA